MFPRCGDRDTSSLCFPSRGFRSQALQHSPYRSASVAVRLHRNASSWVTSSGESCFCDLDASPHTAGTQIAALAMVRANMFFCSMLMLTFLASPQATQVSECGYAPHRVFNSGDGTFSDCERMLADLAKADVVLVGEEHDDPATHRL